MRPSLLFHYRRFVFNARQFPVPLAALLALALWSLTIVYADWNTPLTLDSTGDVGYDTSLEVVNGNPAISYFDYSNGDLKYVRATNADGSAWNSPITLDSAGAVGRYTSLAVVNGNPAISYYDSTNRDLKYVRATNADGSAWNSPITLDSADYVGLYTSLAVVNGYPAISYYDDSNGALKYVRATNADGSAWNSPITLDSAGDLGQYTSLAVVNGNPAISYFDRLNGDLKYVRATNADGSAWNSPITLASADYVGLYTSLAVVNGNPAISYLDSTHTDLKYVRATNADGSTWGTPLTPDSAGLVGWHNSLAVVNGYPAISYFDYATNYDLKYVQATNADGSAWNSPITLDSADYVGLYTSLAVVNGHPAISYYDNSNNDLKYMYYTPPAPEIAVLGNSTEITNDDTSPDTADNTDFGSLIVGGTPITHTFTISNSGPVDLTLNGTPAVTLTSGIHFSVSAQPGSTTVISNSTTTFDVTFIPSAGGSFTDTVHIANNDSDENPYTFVILGTGVTLPVNLSVSTNSGSEAAETDVTVMATASGNVVGNQTVDLGVSGTGITAGDYSLSNTTITIPNGQSSGSVTFTVQNDAEAEGSETATLTISNPSAGISLGAVTSQDVAITDDDTPGFTISTISGDTSEDGDQATFTVRLNTEPTDNVVVNVASSNVAIGTVSPGQLTFTAVTWSDVQTVTVTGVDDGYNPDGDKSYTIQLTIDGSTAATEYAALDPDDVTVVNLDNDLPPIFLPIIFKN
jgi:hypothetical protein